MTEVAVSRARVKAKRRKIRPPKFTPWQKFWLAWCSLGLVANLAWFAAAAQARDLAWTAMFAAFIHETFLDAIDPPHGGFKSGLLGEAFTVLAIAFWIAA